ncbi:SDR family NAD(P)-dependent oxidoreductase [Pseudonocardiaceae bacterium YIM PH 21723]|nr:SDR family NAD(P)-dependent oxidoreductase [Pseudonocardiaceae bacterium YIM PH 21723]
MSNRLQLAGNPVVISGAASGIGRALAQRLSELGSPVAITDWNTEGLKETAASLPGPVLAKVLDVSDNEAQLEWAGQVRDWLPAPLAAVFNNAGVAVNNTVAEGKLEDELWLDGINFHGVVYGTKAFLPILLEQKAGAVVNTSSVYGLAAMPGNAAYSASKFAVRGYTDALRQELRGTGVRAVNIHPGGIKTNIARNARVADGVDLEALARRFERVAMTTPEVAASIIHKGVDGGLARILIGIDAHVFDAVTRITPTYYFELLGLGVGAISRIRKLLP